MKKEKNKCYVEIDLNQKTDAFRNCIVDHIRNLKYKCNTDKPTNCQKIQSKFKLSPTMCECQ